MDQDRMISRRRVLRLLAGGVAATVAVPLLAACGGDDEESATATTATGQDATAPAGAASATAEPAGTPEAEADPAADPEPSGSPDLTGEELVVYSGRNEELVGPIIARFKEESGIDIQVRYAGTSELAAQLLEEGDRSPADLFFAQDAGALGAVAKEGLLAELNDEILDLVDPRFRADDGTWIGVTGRARAVVYNTDELTADDIPTSIHGFTDPIWKGRLGWAPTNASFQSFVTALRVLEGDESAREWLEGIKANDVRDYEGNNPIVTAVIDGEIDAGFVNHYYLLGQEAQAGKDLPAENYIYTNGDPGALINVAGIGMLKTAKHHDAAEAFIEFLLSPEAQEYFADETWEYPLVEGVPTNPKLVPLADIKTPEIDLSNLDDLAGTLELLRDTGIL